MTLMDAELMTVSRPRLRLGVSVEAAFMAMKLAEPFGRAVRAFPAKMVVDPSWLADPPSIAVLNMALAVAVLWAGAFGPTEVDGSTRWPPNGRDHRGGGSRG
jgi:hypothetical protein